MTDAAPPPLPPSPLPAQGQKPSPAPMPAEPPAPAVASAPVESAPPPLQAPARPLRVQGRIVAAAPEEQMIRVATKEGEIRVRSAAPLPPDAEVAVELYMEKTKTLANITVLKKQAAMAEELAQAIAPKAPPPQLKAGDVVTALRLPGNAPPQVPPPQVPLPQVPPPLPPVDKIIQNLLQMKPAEARDFAARLGVPQDAVRQFLKAPDPAAAFRALPVQVQDKIFSFFSAPEPSAVPAKTEAGDMQDNSLLQIIKARLGAATVQRAQAAPVSPVLPAPPAPPASPASPAPPPAGGPPVSGLGALLSVIERIKAPDILPASLSALSTLPFLRGVAAAKAERAAAELLPRDMQEFKVVRIAPPAPKGAPAPAAKAAPEPQPAPAAGAALFEGEVESVTPGGHPVIRRADGAHFVLREPVTVATGSVILFEARPLTPPRVAARAEGGLDPLAPTWPALEEALRASVPEVAQALHRTVPAPTREMTPAALLFLAALRMGEIGNWLGADSLQALRKAGKQDLAARLAGDFGRIAEQAKEALPGGWRMIAMPLLHDEALSQVHFFYRRQDGQEKDGVGDGKPATRFLVNLSLSRMGEMQLDGFLRQKQLDLVLRTRDALPPSMRREIMARFAAGLEQTGMQGGMSFQARKQGWVTVEMPAPGGAVV